MYLGISPIELSEAYCCMETYRQTAWCTDPNQAKARHDQVPLKAAGFQLITQFVALLSWDSEPNYVSIIWSSFVLKKIKAHLVRSMGKDKVF